MDERRPRNLPLVHSSLCRCFCAKTALPLPLQRGPGSPQCIITFNVAETMKAPVYLYYELANFYQNHRRYVKSRSDKQLAGTFYTDPSQLSDCDPLRTLNGKVLDPCGLIANSVFNGALRA